jgi:hypothetical protein
MPREIDWTDADEIGTQPQDASPSSIQSRLQGAATSNV